jgi:hypothetical protein
MKTTIENTKSAAGADSSPSSCSPLVRELMATIEYMRVACEHAEGATPDDQERLAMAMRVGIRMNAKHAGQVADYQMPSFWDDVRGIPASLSLANVGHHLQPESEAKGC